MIPLLLDGNAWSVIFDPERAEESREKESDVKDPGLEEDPLITSGAPDLTATTKSFGSTARADVG